MYSAAAFQIATIFLKNVLSPLDISGTSLLIFLISRCSASFGRIKKGDPWGYGSPDEEDIEVCLRSIDLWGKLLLHYYNVACQAFFYFFSFTLKFLDYFPPFNKTGDVI